ncbi:plasmid maintenance system killer [Glycocaulis albus]|uniref:Plasmid maintenance system killer n=1 Tax=Glycocaulis albus TaxID=1382801 RepID=A0ABQ1XFK5_9PROT|nr:type II toxin-antitoxin system RelE/ParE family toxin [Glycocaulis albus]GGG90158.1 plasmid maintenance system killer [Glycocaulis albus]
MIVSWRDQEARRFAETGNVPRKAGWASVTRIAARKLAQLNAASALDDLRAPPGNRLEPLKGNRAGQYSIRINDQWRVCFVWTDAGPADVEITDYH